MLEKKSCTYFGAEKAIQNQVTEQIDLSDKMNYEQIQISTPDEFVSFAKKCYIDSWSKDKYVTLKSDIETAYSKSANIV